MSMNNGIKLWVQAGVSTVVLSLLANGLQMRAWAEDGPAPAPAPAPEPAPAPAPVTPPAASGAESQAQKLLDEQASNDKKLREEIAAQASAHLEAGKRLFSAFNYEEARKELELAVQLDRTNAESRALLQRVNDIVGVRRDRIKSAVADLYGEHKVSVQEKLVELDNRIDWGKRYMSQAKSDPELSLSDKIRRYQQAQIALERARELIKYMPVEVNVEEQSNEVNRLLSEIARSIKASEVSLAEADRTEAQKLAIEQAANEHKFFEAKVNKMVDQATALYETGQYEESIALANKILEVDPTNPEAHSIISVARGREHAAKAKFLDEEYREQFQLNKERAERFNIPHRDYLIYPKNWHEIAQRTGQEARARPEEAWKQDIRRKLQRRVTFEFVDQTLEDAINFLNSLTKVNIIIDPRIAADGANKTPITLRVSEMELDLALKWILKLADLDYDLRNQAVFITKKANLTANVELEIYDVRDLTTQITDFPGPRIDLGTTQGTIVDPFASQPVVAQLKAPDLVTLIHDRLLPAEFADPATSIAENNGQLVVMQRPEIHDKIRQLLRSVRETQTLQVLTQCRFIDTTDSFLEKIGVSFTGLDAAPGENALPNVKVDPLHQPSKFGLFPLGGGAGLPGGTNFSDIAPSPAFQFSDFKSTPPYRQTFGPASNNVRPNNTPILRPRLDNNAFGIEQATNNLVAGAPAGVRYQTYSSMLGSPVLFQGLTQGLLRFNPLANIANNLGASLLQAPQQGALFQFRFLQSIQQNAILQALRKDQTQDQLLAPKLMQFNNQRSHILVAQQRSYIRDYDVAGAVYDPVISSFLTGVVLEVRPTVSHDRRYITMDVRPGTATEITPPQIIYITNGGDINNPSGSINLPIELPNIELRSISTTVTIPDNGTMLFSGLVNDSKIDTKTGIPLLSDLPIIGRFFSSNHRERVRRNLLILLNARIVLFDEEEAKL
jgi:type II secretory pathway component GspD/PulD (secretin)/Flp pilus assembly protein TadD